MQCSPTYTEAQGFVFTKRRTIDGEGATIFYLFPADASLPIKLHVPTSVLGASHLQDCCSAGWHYITASGYSTMGHAADSILAPGWAMYTASITVIQGPMTIPSNVYMLATAVLGDLRIPRNTESTSPEGKKVQIKVIRDPKSCEASSTWLATPIVLRELSDDDTTPAIENVNKRKTPEDGILPTKDSPEEKEGIQDRHYSSWSQQEKG
ncbi:hypothetical protein BCR43DRAFT_498336, partial [Syncephalastrum racemosum]